jgi:hypothetical protein
MSFWKTSAGTPVQSTGKMEMGGGQMAPIPAGTKVKALITEVKFDTSSERDMANGLGEQFISIRWDIVEGEYKKRVIFQKIRHMAEDSTKRDKNLEMFAAIDFNAGGKLPKDEEPTDMSMSRCLCNSPMILQLQVWEIEDQSKDKADWARGNWVQAVYNATQVKADEPKPKALVQDGDFDDDLSF